MALTLAEILDLEVIRHGEPEIVAGHAHLTRPVRWVHISEQADIASYLKGGEMLLMTGIGLGADPQVHRRFISQLDEVGVSGVLIRLGAAFDELPAALIGEAERRGLPLVALHRRIGYMEVTEQVHRAIVNRQLELLAKAEQIRRDFTDLVLRGVSLPRVLQRLAAITRCPIVLEDAAHQVVEMEPQGLEPGEVFAVWERHSRTGHRDADGTVRSQDGAPGCAWLSISIRGEEWGRLHALAIGRALDDIDLLALDRAAAAVGVVLLTERDWRSAADAARGALISDILNERYRDAREFFRRARSLGIELDDRQLAAIVVDPVGLDDQATAEGFTEAFRHEIRRRLLTEVRAAVAGAGSVSLSALDGDRVLAIIGCPAGRDTRAMLTGIGHDVCERIGRLGDVRLTPVVGVSDETTAPGLRRAIEQAADATRFGRAIPEPGVHHFADLGVFHLLLPLAQGPHLASYVESELGPLLTHDSTAAQPLLPTLRCYLEHSGRPSAAAGALHIQRRTLYHRLARLTRLLGRDLDAAEVRLRLLVALRGLDLLRRQSPAGAAAPADLPGDGALRLGG